MVLGSRNADAPGPQVVEERTLATHHTLAAVLEIGAYVVAVIRSAAAATPSIDGEPPYGICPWRDAAAGHRQIELTPRARRWCQVGRPS